jgi:hypothetical protein
VREKAPAPASVKTESSCWARNCYHTRRFERLEMWLDLRGLVFVCGACAHFDSGCACLPSRVRGHYHTLVSNTSLYFLCNKQQSHLPQASCSISRSICHSELALLLTAAFAARFFTHLYVYTLKPRHPPNRITFAQSNTHLSRQRSRPSHPQDDISLRHHDTCTHTPQTRNHVAYAHRAQAYQMR